VVNKSLMDNFDRRFILLGGKGGVGKTSISASIAVTFANIGQKTLIISTDPAHSLSDSFDQDLSGGDLVKLDGFDNLYAMEINPQEAGGDLKSFAGVNKDDEAVGDFMSSLSTLGFDEVGDLFETMPPGVDEALALAKVIQFLEDEKYQDFKRIIFDTAPTGHTLRLLSLPDFLDSFIGKIYKMRVKMSNITSAFKSMMGMNTQRDSSLDIMDNLKKHVIKVKELFKDPISTEFMIVTIPTIMAANESSRLAEHLKLEGINVNEVIINQIMPDNSECKYCSVRAKNQNDNLKFMKILFDRYNITEIPFFDKEVRGVDALISMGKTIFN
jgi:arsenite-transporting ATPase